MEKKEDLISAVTSHISWFESIATSLKSVEPETYLIQFKYSEDLGEIKKKLNAIDLTSKAGVYGVFVDSEETNKVVQELTAFRNLPKDLKNATPKANGNKAVNGCVYIGKSKDSLNSRLEQHFVKSPLGTRALKVNLWNEEIKNIKFKIYVYTFPKEQHELVRELEKALWKFYQPAIGKM